MQPAALSFEQLKDRMRSTWMAGDFGQIARYSAKGAEKFIDRLPIVPGTRMLDVACGTGNLAVPAARKGAHVTGVDIAPNLLDQARRRAAAEGLEVSFDEGDAENLPYPDAEFDVVMSMFGAMFAPRPERVAAELTRVCRHGGIVAMANWTPDGFFGKTFQLASRYLPPTDGIPAPILWGEERVVRERLGESTSQVETMRRIIDLEYPFPPTEVVKFFREYAGPAKVAFARLDPAMQEAYTADLEGLWMEHNELSNGTTRVRAEYLEVIATRA